MPDADARRPSVSGTATRRDSARRPEVTNGLFLSHKRTERERRCARVTEFRRKRRLSLRTALTGNRCFPTGRATTLQIAGNWQLIVSLGHRASPVPPMSAYVSNLSVPLLLAEMAGLVKKLDGLSLRQGCEFHFCGCAVPPYRPSGVGLGRIESGERGQGVGEWSKHKKAPFELAAASPRRG
jgi:hypothetical protein